MIVILTPEDLSRKDANDEHLALMGIVSDHRRILSEADYVVLVNHGKYTFIKNRNGSTAGEGEPLSSFMGFLLDTLPVGR